MANNFFRQRRIKHLGAWVEALFTALPALSLINFISIIIVLYTQVRPYVLEYTPWMTLPFFVAIFFSLALLTLLVVNVLVVPSLWDYRRKQMMHDESEVMVKLVKIEKKLAKLSRHKVKEDEPV